MNQKSLKPINPEDALKKSYFLIKSKYGNIPYPGDVEKNENNWKIPIKVRYPRILSAEDNIPKKQRFMQEQTVGNISISIENGEILSKPTYWNLHSSIKEFLENVRVRIEKALVKVGTKNFSQLHFPLHMNTPIIDILSFLIAEERIELDKDFEILSEGDREKYMRYLTILNNIKMVRIENNYIFPGDYIVEIEAQGGSHSEQLSKAVTVFFSEGYDYIHRIREVLGSHLSLTGLFYGNSLQYGDIIPYNLSSISRAFCSLPEYGRDKKIKIPRYLFELEKVGLIESTEKQGDNYWCVNEEIFNKFSQEDNILEGLR